MKNFNDKYIIKDFIDKNKWSNVYIAINNETNEKVILNILINISENKENIEDFEEEINKLKSINSSNLISINNMSSYINKDKKYYYIESEYFEGINLYELPKVMDIDVIKSLEIIREVIRGMISLHNKNINYGVLKGNNIFVNSEGRVKISILDLINNHQGHVNINNYLDKEFSSYDEICDIGKLLCRLIIGEEVFKTKKIDDLDEHVVRILQKSSKNSKAMYKTLQEFLKDIDIYLDFKEYQEDMEIEKNKSRIRKYIAIVSSFIILIGVGFSVNHFLSSNNDNKNVKTQNEEFSNKNYMSNNQNKKNTVPEEKTNNQNMTNAISNNKASSINTSSNKTNTTKQNSAKQNNQNLNNNNKKENTKTNKTNDKNKKQNNNEENKNNKHQNENNNEQNKNNEEQNNNNKQEENENSNNQQQNENSNNESDSNDEIENNKSNNDKSENTKKQEKKLENDLNNEK